jgi:hypothetical protein
MENETNIEFITRIMDFSKKGGLMQAFIIEAIASYSEYVKDADLSSMGGLISPEAWRECSTEILAELEKRKAR